MGTSDTDPGLNGTALAHWVGRDLRRGDKTCEELLLELVVGVGEETVEDLLEMVVTVGEETVGEVPT